MNEKRNSRPNPYVGPRAFKYGENLYGRDKETRDILNILIADRIVLLYSPSGAGKSSLIQAALIPKLEDEEDFQVLPGVKKGKTSASRELRVNAQPPSGVDIPPGANRYVLSTLLSIEEGVEPDKQLPLYDLANMDLASYLERRLFADDKNQFTVLIFDQFEEILTLDPTDVKAKTEFFTQLGAVLGNKGLWALFAMREEYLAGLAPYLFPIPTRLRNTYRLDFLSEESALPAMKQPTIDAGVGFTDEAAKRLINDLRQVKVQLPDGTTEDRPGPYIEPVQLQVICRRLWDMIASDDMEIGEDDVEAVGDVTEALASFYSDQVAAIAVETGVREQVIREWFDQQLITSQGIRGQVLESPGQSQGLDNSVILKLVKAHLVRAEKRRNFTWYELAHDRLIRPIKENNYVWFEANLSPLQRQAKIWKTQNCSDDLVLRGKALADAEESVKKEGKINPEDQEFLNKCLSVRSRERRFRFLFRMMAVLFFLMVATTGYAIYEMNKAVNAEEKATFFAADAGIQKEIAWIKEYESKAHAEWAEKKQIEADANAQEARNQAKKADDASEVANNNYRIALSRQLAAEAVVLTSEQPDLAHLLSTEAIRINDCSESRSSLFTVLGRSLPQLSTYLRGHSKGVWQLAFSPKGRQLASADENGNVIIWNTLTKRLSCPPITGLKGPIHSLAFSSDGKLLAFIDNNGRLIIRDLEKARYFPSMEPETGVFMRVTFSPDGKLMAAVNTNGNISLYDMFTLGADAPAPHPVRELPGKGETRALAFTGNGSILASAQGNSFILWDIATGEPLCDPPDGHSDPIYSLAFSSDGKTLATGSLDMKTILWDVTTPCRPVNLLRPLTGHKDTVTGVTFSPDDRVLYSASGDKSVRIWDTTTGQQIGRPLTGQGSSIVSLALSSDGNELATSSMDGSIILWDIYAQQRMGNPLYGMLVPVRGVAFSPNGRKLASVGHDNSIILWDTTKQQQEGTPIAPTFAQGADTREKWVNCIIFHPKEEMLFTGGNDGFIHIWDTKLNKENGAPMKIDNDVLSLALSHDNRFLASGDNRNNVIIWDLKTRDKKDPPLKEHKDSVWSLAFNSDDTILASGGDDKRVCLWDVKSGKLKGEPLTGYSGRVSSVAFSPKDGLLYTAAEDEIVRWDVTRLPPKRHQLFKSKNKDSLINNMEFSPNGSVLAISRGSTVIFIDPETGNMLFEKPTVVVQDTIWSLAFDRQGKTVAAGSSGGNVTLWSPRTGKQFGRFLEGHHRDVQQIAISSDGRLLAYRSNDNKIEIRALGDDKRQFNPLEVRSGETVTALVFSTYSTADRRLYTASNDERGRIISWDLGPAQPTSSPIANGTGYIRSLAISPNGYTLAAGNSEGGINLWDLSKTPPQKHQLPGHTKDAYGTNKGVWSIAFNKDGRLLASGSKGEFIIWDVATGKRLNVHTDEGEFKENLSSLQFSPTAPILAVPINRGDIVLWDVNDPEKIRERNRLRGHSGPVSSFSFSRDGKTLASGSIDHTVRLWDVDSGHSLGFGSMQHREIVNSVFFSGDDKKLYSGGNDGIIMEWDVDFESLKRKAISTAGRNLTKQEWITYLPKQKYSKTHPIPLLLEADLLSQTGKRDAARKRYREIVEMIKTSTDSKLLNSVCWTASVDGYADIVISACDKAVKNASLSDVANYRDSRGVARAMNKPPDIKGAIEDFQAFIAWSETYENLKLIADRRKQWVKDLQTGRNPFDDQNDQMLYELRNESPEI